MAYASCACQRAALAQTPKARGKLLSLRRLGRHCLLDNAVAQNCKRRGVRPPVHLKTGLQRGHHQPLLANSPGAFPGGDVVALAPALRRGDRHAAGPSDPGSDEQMFGAK